MPYCYATEEQDYTDYASGRVIYNLPGAPAFPVRLASEIFQRAVRYAPGRAPFCLFDPTCGGAYHLTALGLLHGRPDTAGLCIGRILASDIDLRALELARRNLGLLAPAGLDQRERELRRMLAEYGKDSHAEALASLARLRARLPEPAVETRTFQANALDPAALAAALQGETVQLVLCDIPYGQLSSWQAAEGLAPGSSPVSAFLETLAAVLPPGVVIAIAAGKDQKLVHPAMRRLERFQIGKRQVSLFTPAS